MTIFLLTTLSLLKVVEIGYVGQTAAVFLHIDTAKAMQSIYRKGLLWNLETKVNLRSPSAGTVLFMESHPYCLTEGSGAEWLLKQRWLCCVPQIPTVKSLGPRTSPSVGRLHGSIPA